MLKVYALYTWTSKHNCAEWTTPNSLYTATPWTAGIARGHQDALMRDWQFKVFNILGEKLQKNTIRKYSDVLSHGR